MSNPVFKSYHQNQVYLFPPSLEDIIAVNHPVRVVSEVMDRIDMDLIIKKYKGGGASSYHPRMLLKVLVYAYLNNVYSDFFGGIDGGHSFTAFILTDHNPTYSTCVCQLGLAPSFFIPQRGDDLACIHI